MLDIEADHITIGVETNGESVDNLAHLGARRVFEFDIEAVGFRVIASWPVRTDWRPIYAGKPEIASKGV
jgi:hypothetical protein